MPKDNAPQIGLALQGGAHAALTWGVLDRLLDEVEQGGSSALSGDKRER
ncbi:hypothetical protein [Caballeronia sp. KNU42]